MGTYDTIGGTPRHDPSYDYDLPCEICGKDPVFCDCPECPVCHEVGNPNCYKEHGLSDNSQCTRPSGADAPSGG